ncbi:MAG: hypothetical protein PUC36_00730 [Clostridiales bacterium]|nr:hypothetical protein [Clostridiales bacterium]
MYVFWGGGKRPLLPPLRDPQLARPTAWCIRCRGEIYEGDGPLCPVCRAEEREKEDTEEE